jgi:hypothetical protein
VIQVRQDGDGAELTAPPLIEGLPTAVRFALRHR